MMVSYLLGGKRPGRTCLRRRWYVRSLQVSILCTSETRFLTRFNACFSEPFPECADADSEVIRDPRERHVRAAIQRDPVTSSRNSCGNEWV